MLPRLDRHAQLLLHERAQGDPATAHELELARKELRIARLRARVGEEERLGCGE